jgi:DUF4097 and DUF4098 domain-containing protein YvlB
MGINFRLRLFLALIVILALAEGISASDYEGSFEKTLAVSSPVELDVVTGSGNIEVQTGASGSVRVRGTIRVSRKLSPDVASRRIQEIEDTPPIEQSGNFIRIGYPGGVRRFVNIGDAWRHVSISYEVMVPADTRLKSETGSGDQSIAGVKGPVKATTGSGNIRLSNLAGDTRANTGSGDVEINNVAGMVYAETGSGNIRAAGISGSIRASTGSGDVRLEQSAKDAVTVKTGSGNLEVHGVAGPLNAETGSGNISASGEPGGNWKLETGSGNVTLKLSAQAAFNLHAHTGSGSIETNHPITVQGKIGRTELRGVVRGGGAFVTVGTGSGNIRIE